MSFLPYLADRVLNRPLLIHPGKAETILSVLEGRIVTGSAGGDETELEASRFIGDQRRGANGAPSLYRASGGTAIITIDGSLVNRGAWVGASSGLTSYEGISAQIDQAAADPAIRAIVLDLNSFGGEASGMVSLAAKIRAARAHKRVFAVVNDVAASAAYGIASAAHEIVVSPTSVVGSIGVVMMHLDRSGELNAKGVRPTLIFAGARKADGNPFSALSDQARAKMQSQVDALREEFAKTVEAGRGARLTAAMAKATEARTYIGEDAIKAGLADRMATLDDILAELSRPATSPGASPGTTTQARTASAASVQAGPDPEEVKRKADMLEQQERAAQAEAHRREAKAGWAKAVAARNERLGLATADASGEDQEGAQETEAPSNDAPGGWARAVERVNARHEPMRGDAKDDPRSGWAKAAAAANARH